MVQDLLTNHGMPAQVDKTAFQVGRNLAVSAGAVVFRNEVLELIQYTPAGASVFARPLVIVPPQINKFYLFDLAPGRSVVEYLVRNNFQVFAISWRNPTSAQRDWNMDTYVEALLEAIDAARSIADVDSINLAGACSGAMTLSALLGHLAAKRDFRVHAATLIVVVLDRSDESQIALFATPATMAAAKRASQIRGVLGGEEMGRTFAWMRPNDLIWNYWVNNYLLGNAPPAFDILYWNSDTTRLPARFHGQVLDIYVDNGFAKPGGVTVLGTAIDLTRVDCDKYIVAGITDHITPWQGGYRVARLLGGKTDFILSSSGHIQSIINPPGNPKAKYFINSSRPTDPARWLAEAKAIRGSWWDDWRQWLEARSGPSVSARPGLGNRFYPKLTEAPGTYVLAS